MRWRKNPDHGSATVSHAVVNQLLDLLRLDLRFGVRSLVRSPGFVLVSVLSLASGIAGATALFSLVNAALLRPPPHVDHPEELVSVYSLDVARRYGPLSYPDVVDIREQAQALESVAVVASASLTVTSSKDRERTVYGEQAGASYFDVLGVAMALGRGFTAAEVTNGENVVVIGHRRWLREHAGDPDALGSTIRIDGRQHTIVGVAPPGLLAWREPFAIELWVPVSRARQQHRGSFGLQVVGRMQPGASIGQVRAQLDLISDRLVNEYPEYWNDFRGEPLGLAALSERESRIPPNHRAPFAVFVAGLLVVMVLVLAVACSNVANLMVGRAIRRRREIAVRQALGAVRGRLVAQMLTESVMLSLLAGTCAVVVTSVLGGLLAKGHGPLPLALDATVDVRVAGFALLLALSTAIAFGMAPALQSSRPDLVSALKGGDDVGRRRRFALRNLLVMVQVAGSLVLVVGAALMMRSFQQARAADLGFDPANTALLTLDLDQGEYDEAGGRQLFSDLRTRLERLPGVERVALARTVLLGSVRMSDRVEPEGSESSGAETAVGCNFVGPGYFRTVGIPFLRGRDFEAADAGGGPRVVIVNRSFAERFWPGEDPLGKRVTMGEPARVVGVVADAMCAEITQSRSPHVWTPFAQHYSPEMTLHVRTSSDPRPLLAVLRDEVRSLDPELPVVGLELMDDVVDNASLTQRTVSTLLGAAGSLTLALAAIGLYGVMAFAVGQRQRELGIRIALGARPGRVVLMVVREGLALSAVGVGAGLALVAAVTPLLRSVLFGVSPLDPASVGSGVAVLLGAGVAASALPALRAAGVDPVQSLRCE